YAFLVHGLLNLHDATKEDKWLGEAKKLTDVMLEFHLDKKNGGFFYTSSDHEKLFARSKDQFDGAQPSGNSVAARHLVRLWIQTRADNPHDAADKSFNASVATPHTTASGSPTLAEARGMYLDPQKKK